MLSKTPVIIDTDVFGDADDILALTYVLANKNKIDLKLIVTADEHRGMRASWLQFYFDKAGITVPVVAGEDIGNTRLFLFDQIKTDQINFNYIDEIKKIIDDADKITYLCLAPQSNLAKFIEKFPRLKNKIEVRGMGAVLDIDLGRIEHNVRYDIQAFKRVANEMRPKLLLADHTWDDSMRFNRDHEIYQFLSTKKHPLAQAIVKNADAFFDKLHPQSRLHDPIIASTLFADFISYAPEKMIIEDSGKTRRPTKMEVGTDVVVSTAVDYEKVYNHFFASLKRLCFE